MSACCTGNEIADQLSKCAQKNHNTRSRMSSFAIIGIGIHSGGHCHCSHFPPQKAAHPHQPDASVWIVNSGTRDLVASWRKPNPFQLLRNMCHQDRSERNSLFKRVHDNSPTLALLLLHYMAYKCATWADHFGGML